MKEPTVQLHLAFQAIQETRIAYKRAMTRAAIAELQRNEARCAWQKAKAKYRALKNQSKSTTADKGNSTE
jgi:hypothetical protein